ncbi:MAG: DUF3365 domain-containing protein [Sulfuricurvum sp.]|nr:DUF3365 domain-containing protein [Sulfuricurvum sp.]
MKKHQLLKIFYFLAACWTLLIAFFIGFIIYQKQHEIQTLALLEAKTSINKDLSFRTWIASKGGVYAPISKNTPINPYLKVTHRDVNTTDGLQLTLINPAYALRQITDSYQKYSTVKDHLTSLKLLNPHNAPEPWERDALQQIEITHNDLYHFNDQNTLHYMKPFFIDEQCMKCHKDQGYKIGDIRGGLSIAIPLNNYEKIFITPMRNNIIILFIIWIMGLFGIYRGYRISHDRIHEKIALYEQNLLSLVSLIEQRDNYTAGHGRRVGEYSRLIAKQMGLSLEQQEELYRAGTIHDIGKVAIPDSILLKPGALDTIERTLIEEHVNAGYNLLKQFDIFASLAEIVRYHHERIDGSGYPNKLKGDMVPLLAQIMAVADCFDAMTTNRIYKGRKSLQEALDELSSIRGVKFLPEVIDAALISLSNLSLEAITSQRPTSPLEMERFSYFYKDALTGVYTSAYLNFLFFEPDFGQYEQLWMVNLGNISQFNKAYGWSKGDDLLKRYAQMLQERYPQLPIIRFQGDDFIIFRKDNEKPQLIDFYAEWLKEVGIAISISVIPLDSETTTSLDILQSYLAKH